MDVAIKSFKRFEGRIQETSTKGLPTRGTRWKASLAGHEYLFLLSAGKGLRKAASGEGGRTVRCRASKWENKAALEEKCHADSTRKHSMTEEASLRKI